MCLKITTRIDIIICKLQGEIKGVYNNKKTNDKCYFTNLFNCHFINKHNNFNAIVEEMNSSFGGVITVSLSLRSVLKI